MSVVSEANIQAEFYWAIKNLIESGKGRFDSVDFTRVSREHRVDGGFADLVVFGKDKGMEIHGRVVLGEGALANLL